ncbi:macro domain-containing protein [Dysgonomonas capnocytophagoides]|uniref:hypothetical protein n=1 Tax=Dysgonomonas capnocytophagoides TaxID=45254 RepID=UPI0004139F98|nr:hypothetical protein [Dysgonomonas capnocytophagoides]
MIASVYTPRIGCGLAGIKWKHIEPLIEKTLLKHDIYIAKIYWFIFVRHVVFIVLRSLLLSYAKNDKLFGGIYVITL